MNQARFVAVDDQGRLTLSRGRAGHQPGIPLQDFRGRDPTLGRTFLRADPEVVGRVVRIDPIDELNREVIEGRSNGLAPTRFGPADHGQVLHQHLPTKPIGRPEDAVGPFDDLFHPRAGHPGDVLGRIDPIDWVEGAPGPRPIRADKATPMIKIR